MRTRELHLQNNSNFESGRRYLWQVSIGKTRRQNRHLFIVSQRVPHILSYLIFVVLSSYSYD